MNSFQQWFRGLISVAISSAASGVALVVADPQSFNLQSGLPKLAEVCGVLALVHVALYLQKSPIWGDSTIQVNAPSADTVNVTNTSSTPQLVPVHEVPHDSREVAVVNTAAFPNTK